MADCQEAIYSEDYEDYIIEYTGQEEEIEDIYRTSCYQFVNNQFGVVYRRGEEVEWGERNSLVIVPRCFGLLNSSQTLEEAGVSRVQRQPNLALYGSGVLLGIVDTGAGVRKEKVKNEW